MRKTRYIILIGFMFIGVLCRAQQTHIIDSLTIALKNSEGTAKIDAMTQLAWEIKYNETGKAFQLSERALILADSINYPLGKAKALQNLAGLESLVGQYQKGVIHAKSGLKYAEKAHHPFTTGKLHNIIGLCYRELNNYEPSTDHFYAALHIFKQLNDSVEISGVLNNLGLLYQNISDYAKALETFIQVMEIEERLGNIDGLARTYNNVGIQYFRSGKYDVAITYHRKALLYSKKSNNQRFLSSALHGLGADFELKTMPDSALFYFLRAAEINIKNGYLSWLANNYTRIADVYLSQKKQPKLFAEFVAKAIQLYKTQNDWSNYVQLKHLLAQVLLKEKRYDDVGILLKDTELFADSNLTIEQKAWFHKVRNQYYHALGQPQLAYHHLLQQKKYDDSLTSVLQQNADREVEARFRVDKKEQENEKLRLRNGLNAQIIFRQRILVALLIVIAILLVISIVWIGRSRAKTKTAHKRLEEQKYRIEKQAEELAHSNASKDKFLSIIAHDLRNPFNAILGFSELLLNSDYEFTETEKQQFLKSINTSADHASKLLDNLLLWARSRMGKTEFEPQPVDLQGIAFECSEIAQAMADNKQLNLRQDFETAVIAYCDPAMIRTVILNLLTNAIKFTPKNGTITIAGKLVDDHVEVCVEDTGVGIAPDILKKLFKLNHHVVMPGTENEYGTGMGLLLCDEFIKKNNGKITVLSEENKGSRFCIELPRAEIN